LCRHAPPHERLQKIGNAPAVERDQAKWKAKAGLYTTTHVRAALDGQPRTIAFLEKEFGVNVRELVE